MKPTHSLRLSCGSVLDTPAVDHEQSDIIKFQNSRCRIRFNRTSQSGIPEHCHKEKASQHVHKGYHRVVQCQLPVLPGTWHTACTGRWWTMPHTAQTSYRDTSICQPLKKVVKDCRFSLGKDMKAMVVQWFQHESRVFIDGMCRHSTPVGIRSEQFLDWFHLNKLQNDDAEWSWRDAELAVKAQFSADMKTDWL